MANKRNPHSGHRERMRERYLRDGIGTFAPHEVLEMVLYHVVPRKDTNVTAHTLIDEFGSFSGVLNASAADLMKAGLTESAATYIHMLPDVFRFYQKDTLKENPKITSTRHAADCLVPVLQGSVLEEVAAVCLDAKNRILRQKVIKKGTPSKIDISIREITQFALSSRAVSVVIGHSHPGGGTKPSEADTLFTKVLYETLMALDIVLLEHLIVAENGEYFSYHQEGEFSRLNKEYKEKYPSGLSRTVEDFE